jgi:endo-1,4-beta-mannosidase
MPEPDTIDEDMAARFADFLDRHAEQRMTTIPAFIVGHMSGENWDPFRLADAARLCDFLGPHAYPVGDDQIRQHYAAAWQCELAGTFGRPVVLEEFGVSSDFASEPNAARYYRHVRPDRRHRPPEGRAGRDGRVRGHAGRDRGDPLRPRRAGS